MHVRQYYNFIRKGWCRFRKESKVQIDLTKLTKFLGPLACTQVAKQFPVGSEIRSVWEEPLEISP